MVVPRPKGSFVIQETGAAPSIDVAPEFSASSPQNQTFRLSFSPQR